MLGFRIGIRDAFEGIAADPISARVGERADIAGLQTFEGFEVDGPVTLLESKGEVLRRIAFLARGNHAADPFKIHAGGLFTIDMLLRLYRGLQHAGMLERR